MKKIKFFVLICFLLLTTSSSTSSEIRTFKEIIKSNNIYLSSKSIKGWIRIFKSKEKTKYYDINITEIERKILYSTLKQHLREYKCKHEMRIK